MATDSGSSLQARGLAVVTTSGTLVTLIFAIAQSVSGGKILARLPDASRWLLAIATVAFVAAAVGGLVTNIPRLFARPRLKEIADQIESGWSGPAAVAEKTVARARVHQLQELESANDVAARAVLSGLAAEVLAIALAAAAKAELPVAAIVVNIQGNAKAFKGGTPSHRQKSETL